MRKWYAVITNIQEAGAKTNKDQFAKIVPGKG
jgi:hypothetical protein